MSFKFAIIPPTYKEIFGEEAPELAILLADVPSLICIQVITLINAELFFSKNEKKTQENIRRLLCARFTSAQICLLVQKLYPFIQKNYPIFFRQPCLDFIQYELSNYRDLPLSDNIPPEVDYKIFKAYIIFVEQYQNKQNKIASNNDVERDESSYYRTKFLSQIMFHSLLDQFDQNKNVEDYYFFCGIGLFKFLTSHPDTQSYVNSFLLATDSASILDYLTKIVMVFSHKDENIFNKFIFNMPDSFLKNLKIDLAKFNTPANLIAYKGIKSQPIFKVSNDKFIVLDFHFLIAQLYKGLIFSFYELSGINNTKKFRKLPDFLSFLASEFSEKQLFQKALSIIFNKHTQQLKGKKSKNTVLHFDSNTPNQQIDGVPDAYYRYGNKIFIFEFKDTLMNGELADNRDSNKIYADLINKFSHNKQGHKKGVSQLIQHIKKINAGSFSFDNFEEKEITRENIEIYSILVGTHNLYNLPGFRNYLNQIFQAQKHTTFSSGIDSKLKVHIKPLIMFDFEVLYRLVLNQFSGNFSELCDSYLSFLETAEIVFNKKPNEETHANIHASFNDVNLKIIRKYHNALKATELLKLFGFDFKE